MRSVGAIQAGAHFADLEKAVDNFNFGPTKHEMFHNPQTGKIGGALDIIGFGIHDGTNSHLDALCHYRLNREGKLLVFNGRPQDLDEAGCKANAIDRTRPGIFTRGIPVDLPLHEERTVSGAGHGHLRGGAGGVGEVRRRDNRQRRCAVHSHGPVGAAREAGTVERGPRTRGIAWIGDAVDEAGTFRCWAAMA